MKNVKTIPTDTAAPKAAIKPLHVDAAGKNSFAPAELKRLVLAAQAHDQAAIDTLCEAFRPLIMKEAHVSYVQNKLGEDAENTAWEIFLEFIMGYDDHAFGMLPGLVKSHLHYALIHRVYRQKSVLAQLFLDETDEEGNKIFNPPCYDVQTERLELLSELNYVLRILSKKQREIIRATVLGNMDLKAYSQKINLDYSAAFKLRKRALANLKRALAC